MSVRKAIVLLLALSTIVFLAACGGSSKINPVPPPTGGFSDSNLNGTYVFSVSGTDESGSGAAYSMVGTLTANGSGGITGGTLDINDNNTAEFTSGPVVGATINGGGSYNVSVDGRGQATFGINVSGFPKITLDFVLSSDSQGLVTEFDTFGTGSGTLDAQTASVTPTGPYAFSLSGATYSGSAFAAVGNFTLGSGGAINPGSGFADFNNGALTISTAQALTGAVIPVSSTPSTLSTQQYPSLAFDVYPIDNTHLKFVETDTNGTLSGDAYSQTTTAIPAETLAFTIAGDFPSGTPFAGGGFMVTDGAGNITDSSSEDFNGGGTLSPTTPVTFTGNYVVDANDAGRYTLTTASGFSGGTTFAAYPSSGGLLLLEIDPAGVGITVGAGYPTTAGATFAAAEGYGLNLTGVNLSAPAEVDDIAEFTANSTGATVTGLIDENSSEEIITFDTQLSGTYGAPSGGRGTISATAGTNSSNSTLNTGFGLIFYTVDGITFPFMEYDSGQVATGVFVQQAATSSSAVAHQHMFVMHPPFHPNTARGKKQ